MADKKNDSLFQWNFNLEDSDSDFTDIDFSNSARKGSDSSDKDIQPIIFVRDETAKKKTEEKRSQYDEPAAPAKRPQSTQKKAAPARKPAAKKKKGSRGPELNWRLIVLIAAGILVVAGIVLLLGRCGKKEVKAWTKVEADSKVKTLMDRYFAVKKEGDAQEMRKVLVPDAIVNASVLGVESQIYTDYTDIVLQQYPGIKKDETVVCATYDTELGMIKASVPTISWFYALPDSTNNLRLMTITEMEKEENKSIYNYVVAAYSQLADTTVKDVETRYTNAVESNSILRQYLDNIKKGNYYEIPTAEVNPTDNPVDPTQPSQQTSTEEPGTVPQPTGNVMYVKADTLNMRSGPTTAEQNVIWKLTKGYCVTVISQENGWCRIKDDITTNPASGASQGATYAEGYVSADYLVSDYSSIAW